MISNLKLLVINHKYKQFFIFSFWKRKTRDGWLGCDWQSEAPCLLAVVFDVRHYWRTKHVSVPLFSYVKCPFSAWEPSSIFSLSSVKSLRPQSSVSLNPLHSFVFQIIMNSSNKDKIQRHQILRDNNMSLIFPNSYKPNGMFPIEE